MSKYHFIILMILSIISTVFAQENTLCVNSKIPQKPLIKILAIDGGGVRGIIPAYVLADLEKRLPKGKKIGEYFDIIAGTSAGGILALMLTVPDDNQKPKYSAAYIMEQFTQFSEEVFTSTFSRKILSGGGLWHVKYSGESLTQNLEKYFGNNTLSQTVTNVIIPTYEIERDMTFFFKTHRAKNELKHDCLIRDLAYATAAAPTYFPPAIMTTKNGRSLTLVDGGVSTNNPALAATVHALEIYGKDIKLFVVSLGTGTTYGDNRHNIEYKNVKKSGIIGWMQKVVPLMIHASNAVIDYEMHYVLNFNKPQYYVRIQTFLDNQHSELDNINKQNIQALKNYAQILIEENEEILDCIADILSKKDFYPELCKNFFPLTSNNIKHK